MEPSNANSSAANAWADKELLDSKYEMIPQDDRNFVRQSSGIQDKWIEHTCARERIHTPGAVQPHAFVIVMRGENLEVTQVSANFSALGYELKELCNVHLQDIVGEASSKKLKEDFMGYAKCKPMTSIPIEMGKGSHRKTFTGLFHIRGEWSFLELEPHVFSDLDMHAMLYQANMKLFAANSVHEACQAAVEIIQTHTGYDRVMTYMFHEDKHGEVIAEKRRDGVETYLGMHFPAIDIPDQARALFIRNVYTHIPDVQYNEVPLAPERCPVSGDNPDMSLVCARACSPGHLIYLSNMGVSSTFILALIVNGELWGLIVCHNLTPKYVPFADRVACTLLAETVDLFIKLESEKVEMAEMQRAHLAREAIIQTLQETDDFEQAFTRGPQNIGGLIDCSGACIVHGDSVLKLGSTPSDTQIIELVAYAAANCSGDLCTPSLCEVYPAATAFSDVASGCLLKVCSDGLVLKERIAFVWFRQSLEKSINWGGNPDSAYGPNGLQPRCSFKRFTARATVTALPWSRAAQQAAAELIQGFTLHEACKRCKQGKDLLQTMNVKDQFLANVSHEIRTPLYAINALAELCLEKPYAPQEIRGHLEMISESGTSLLGLLNDVIDVRRLEAGKLELNNQEVDVVKLARFCLKMFCKQVANKGLEGNIIYQDILCAMRLSLDKTRMQQLIVNLVSNALKFTDKGSISIRLTYDVPKEELTVRVEDTGIGIKAEHIPRLFTKFSQVANTETRLFHGAGLGLSIVQQLVDLMGGQVGVESEWEKGSHFWFTVPAQPWAGSVSQGAHVGAYHEERVIEPHTQITELSPSPSSHAQIVELSPSMSGLQDTNLSPLTSQHRLEHLAGFDASPSQPCGCVNWWRHLTRWYRGRNQRAAVAVSTGSQPESLPHSE